jgi:hypothetical protein
MDVATSSCLEGQPEAPLGMLVSEQGCQRMDSRQDTLRINDLTSM